MLSHKAKTISVWSLVLIIIATEFGFSNITNAFYQMSYASIIWYVLCAVIYLFPLAMIFAEYSGSIKNDHGGFYTWLINSIGEKWAFIGTFVWVASWVITMLQNVSGMGINISGMLFGKDESQSWHFWIFNSNELEAVMGIFLIIITTFVATKGVRKIADTATFGGIISLTLIAVFTICSIVILIADHGHLAQPIHGIKSFIKSPSPAFQSPIAILSFIIYAMFAYGGIESSCGFIDKMKNPRKSFPKAMIYVSILMTCLYGFGILLCGFGINWKKVMGGSSVNLYNNSFAMMNGIGNKLASSLGWKASTGALIGDNLNRILSIGSLVPLISFMVVLTYSPIKSLIAGSSKDLWPKKVAHFNKHDMPACAMWIECAVVVVALAFISVAGDSGQQFYTIITDMGNIGSVYPYYFIVLGFIAFKKRKDLDHKIVFFHSKFMTYLVVAVLTIAMTFGIAFNLVNPLMEHQYATAFWTFVGPVFFTALAMFMYHLAVIKRAKRMINENMSYEKSHE